MVAEQWLADWRALGKDFVPIQMTRGIPNRPESLTCLLVLCA